MTLIVINNLIFLGYGVLQDKRVILSDLPSPVQLQHSMNVLFYSFDLTLKVSISFVFHAD